MPAQDSTFRKIYTRDRRGAPLADRLKDRLGVRWMRTMRTHLSDTFSTSPLVGK